MVNWNGEPDPINWLGITGFGNMAIAADGDGWIVKLIAITSGKGGTGKSCVTAYTGMALAGEKQKTLLVEAGGNVRSLDLIAAMQPESAFDLGDVLSGGCQLQDAIAATVHTEHLFVLPAPMDGLRPDPEQFFALMDTLREEYNYVLVDGVDFSVFSPQQFDLILMVTTPDSLSVRACQHLARQLYAAGAQQLRLVINDVPVQPMPIQGANDFDDVIDLIGAQLIAVLPHSPTFAYSANNARKLEDTSIVVRVFDNLAARLRGQSRPLLIR